MLIQLPAGKTHSSVSSATRQNLPGNTVKNGRMQDDYVLRSFCAVNKRVEEANYPATDPFVQLLPISICLRRSETVRISLRLCGTYL